jgi:TRAP-type uncharacterized transport system substrate-binding protein
MVRQGKANRRKLSEISSRALLMMIIVALLVTLSVIVVVNHFIQPPPPKILLMTTGVEGGTYAVFGEQYRQILAREKVHLELLPSSGSVENFIRLRDKSSRVDVGFVQGGTSSKIEAPDLLSLGALFYSPLWVFYRSPGIYDDLSQLKGKKINIGPEGSGIRKFALTLLEAGKTTEPPTSLFNLPTPEAAKALIEGNLDAVMIFGVAENAIVQELLRRQGIKLMSFNQAEAYTRLFPALSHIVLPMGILDLARKIPPADRHLLAITNNLVVRNNLHPALVYLLLEAATEIHSGSGWVNKAGEFPSPKAQDFPLSDQAERFYKSGRPFLYDYLPFWAATFVDRLVLILVPTAVVLIPLIRIMPWLYSWRNRRKFFYWYGELKNLELEVMEIAPAEQIATYQTRLNQIEAAVNQVHVPLAFFHEAYNLKEHIELVRGKITRLNQQTAAGHTPAPSAEQQRE